jgi:tetratricopeptide (TPR) repeat protein
MNYRHVGDRAAATATADRALQLIQPLLAADDVEPRLRLLGVEARGARANVAFGALDHAAAVPLFEQNVAELEALRADDPGEVAYAGDLATTLEKLGSLAGARRDHGGAFDQFEHARVLREFVASRLPDDADALRALAANGNQRAAALTSQARHGEAVAAYESVVRIDERLLEVAPDNPECRTGLVAARLGFANALLASDRCDDAEVQCREALRLVEPMIATDRDNVRLRPLRAIGAMQLGDVFDRRGSTGDDRAAWREARTRYERSRAELVELGEQGKLAGPFRGLPARITGRLAECTAALGDR